MSKSNEVHIYEALRNKLKRERILQILEESIGAKAGIKEFVETINVLKRLAELKLLTELELQPPVSFFLKNWNNLDPEIQKAFNTE
ncbi:MAG: hypothetical protein AAB612_04150 [Patescibacteria group bacterium]